MLRITARIYPGGIALELEGKLAGLWTRELESCWEKSLVENQPLRVVLKAVSFIDPPGKSLLAKMYRNGTKLEGEGCMTKAIIEEITHE